MSDDNGFGCSNCSSLATKLILGSRRASPLNKASLAARSCALTADISCAERYGSLKGSAQGPGKCGGPAPGYGAGPIKRARSKAWLEEVVAIVAAREWEGSIPTDTGGGGRHGGGTLCGRWRGASFPPTIITSSLFPSSLTLGSNVLDPGLDPGLESGRPSVFILEEGNAPGGK